MFRPHPCNPHDILDFVTYGGFWLYIILKLFQDLQIFHIWFPSLRGRSFAKRWKYPWGTKQSRFLKPFFCIFMTKSTKSLINFLYFLDNRNFFKDCIDRISKFTKIKKQKIIVLFDERINLHYWLLYSSSFWRRRPEAKRRSTLGVKNPDSWFL